ncbi:hypothetical protein [Pseudonocardia sp. N23]|uniref:hypothetical protein n=1 Tax=Pseudonocardia sp. N23 TaxID=1987376 RepID=UPI000BFE01AA|nr:hypothetical protein [Pseudonocardia sp. N23]
MSTIYDDAIAAIPGVRELDEQVSRAQKLYDAVRNNYAVPRRMDILAEVVSGNVDPDELMTRAAQDVQTDGARQRAQDAAHTALTSLQQGRPSLLSTGVDSALEVVRTEVQRIHERAREVLPALGSVSSELEVINFGLAGEWKQVTALTRELHAARQAQWKLLCLRDDMLASTTVELHGYVRGFDLRTLHESSTHWRVSTHIAVVRPVFDLAYLREFAALPFGGEFGVWVPTTDEFAQEQQDQAERDHARSVLLSPMLGDREREHAEQVACGRWETATASVGGPTQYRFHVTPDIAARIVDGDA